MLPRLFQRQASANRVESAIEHSKAIEQRDALRERSATILARLEHKRLEARRVEVAQRKADHEAMLAEREAEQAAAHEAATPAPAVDAAPSEEPVEVEAGFADTAVTDEVPETGEAETDDASAEETMTEYAEDLDDDWAAVDDAPEETHAVVADELFSESEPLRTHVDAPPMAPDHAVFAEEDYADETGDAWPDEAATDEDETGIAQDDFVREQSSGQEPKKAASPVLDDDAYEQIRKKAEEARIRIARRLEQMKQEQQATGFGASASGRLDLGEDTPPLSPQMQDEHED